MQFSYPEVLYALFLLLISIIVHLFQLRRFKTEYFTNVKFLKKLSQNTRKSSQLKKYLLLTCRLLFLTFLILAFAKPYFPTAKKKFNEVQTFVYLDNSYSMQANGQKGRLLERAKQELLGNLSNNQNFTLITNDDIWENIDNDQLQEITYSPQKTDLKSIMLQINGQISRNNNVQNRVLLISDFASEMDSLPISKENENVSWFYLLEEAENMESVSIDSVFILQESDNTFLKIELSKSGGNEGSVPVSIFDAEKLLGKNSAEFKNSNNTEVSFPLNDSEIEKGRIIIDDPNLLYDNTLYFTINKSKPVVVSTVNAVEDDFLKKLYLAPEFEYNSFSSRNTDFSVLNTSQVLIINELTDLSTGLASLINEMKLNDAVIIFILPSSNISSSYQSFLENSGFKIGDLREEDNLITTINYDHPVFKNTFSSQTSNFDYPTLNSYYSGNQSNSLINFQDGTSFVAQSSSTFLVQGAINKENSNFQNSPLIVPIFYNMAVQNNKSFLLYQNIGSSEEMAIEVKLAKNEILRMENEEISFIPQQRQFSNKVVINTSEMPIIAGTYKIQSEDSVLSFASFNYNRSEKIVNRAFVLPDEFNKSESVSNFFETSANREETNNLWKWFVTFALLFLILETLLIKYFK